MVLLSVCLSYKTYVDTVIFYLFISFLISFVSVVILSFWYNRWDGISEMEE